MSGGGYSAPEVNVGGMGPTDCSRLRFSTVLASVQSELLSQVAVGDQLSVSLMGSSAPHQVISVLAPSGDTLGSITDRWAELKHCLELGASFVAELQSTDFPVRALIKAGV
jgi:hypothetical protein